MRARVIATGAAGNRSQNQVDFDPTDTVAELYNRVATVLNTRADAITLTYHDKPLEDKSKTVQDIGLKDGSELYAVVTAEGGGWIFRRALRGETQHLPNPNFLQRQTVLSRSTSDWLNREYAAMRQQQPGAVAIDLRNYTFDFRPQEGQFAELLFPLVIRIRSPYNPPEIHCYDAHGHPNFFPNGRLCIHTPWTFYGAIWEYLERVKTVIIRPNYNSRARI